MNMTINTTGAELVTDVADLGMYYAHRMITEGRATLADLGRPEGLPYSIDQIKAGVHRLHQRGILTREQVEAFNVCR